MKQGKQKNYFLFISESDLSNYLGKRTIVFPQQAIMGAPEAGIYSEDGQIPVLRQDATGNFKDFLIVPCVLRDMSGEIIDVEPLFLSDPDIPPHSVITLAEQTSTFVEGATGDYFHYAEDPNNSH